MTISGALGWTGAVLLLVSFIATLATDSYGYRTRKVVASVAWTALTLGVLSWLAAIWTDALEVFP